MEKHLVPFNELMFKKTLICMLLHVVLIHEQILFESTKNGHADCKIVLNLLTCMGEPMVASIYRLLQRESCEWKYGKRCCTTIQLGVTTEPIDVVCRTQNT
jgi:hypothetical protein